MASTHLPPIVMDHLYSMDNNLKVGGPLLPLKEACENPVVGNEPPLEIVPYQKSWSEWVDRELLDPSTCDILRRAQVLDAIFLSKLWDIHVEAKMLRHKVRRWSTATHTFVCPWGEFTPTLEDVANISRLPFVLHVLPKSKAKARKPPAVPKHRSMRILQTWFAGTRQSEGEDSGPKVVVTVEDDDDGSDEDDAIESGISAREQGSIRSTSGTNEDLDEDQYYNPDEGTYPAPYTHLEEPADSDIHPRFASNREQRVNTISV
ncbi:uncharacterized protein Pyn_37627 [Prunus yedoensis var. nudiflora]|uniref:Uncharacterized protein n=1 Tax=Prunus yedoensis var. nudiflora TaxID=2094558 RepID=A0A314U8L6_PRUYE|nr:uncharacterized protein Pyn_37627 [Prunus yedoensis var. nudiflora]